MTAAAIRTGAVVPCDPSAASAMLDALAARYVEAGGVLPAHRAGRFDRERLPEPLAYYTETAGLTFRERRGRWRTTRCDFHGGSDSMRINTETGAFCCMACGASGGDVLSHYMRLHGLSFVEAARALGAWIDDPRAPLVPINRRPAGLSASDALSLLRADFELVAIAALRIARGRGDERDRRAVLEAAERIRAVLTTREASHAV